MITATSDSCLRHQDGTYRYIPVYSGTIDVTSTGIHIDGRAESNYKPIHYELQILGGHVEVNEWL